MVTGNPEETTRAIRVHRHGGPEVLSPDRIAVAAPGPGEIRIRNRAIGLNFTDVYFREGHYAPPQLPFVPGTSAPA